MMKILIVEDEKLARENLRDMLLRLDANMEILAYLDKVSTTVDWLRNNKADLIFLDIHLADANSFKIFDQIEVKTPIIFTTAYDKYAIQAFKVNSIDYLLKPIIEDELRKALTKFHSLQSVSPDWLQIKEAISKQKDHKFQKRFLVKKGDKYASVRTMDVAFFEGEDRYVYLVKKDGKKYFVDHTLSDLEHMLDPSYFFRLNRSFICHFDSINGILAVSKSRVKVNLEPHPSRDIIVSTEVTRQFKIWLNR